MPGPPSMSLRTVFARTVVAVAGLKVLVAAASVVLALLVGNPGAHAGRAVLLLLAALAFATAGLVLLAGARTDARAGDLGALLVLAGSAFADHLVAPLWPRATPFVTLARAVLALQADAFTPYFLWRFARAFPRAAVSPAGDRRFARATRACLALGTILFSANLFNSFVALAPAAAPPATALSYLSREAPAGAYWFLQFGLLIAALITLGWRARGAPPDERRRVALLAAGLAAGLGPTLVWSLLAMMPAFFVALPLRVAGWVIYPTLLSAPFTTAYAVLVRRALDVRLVVRRALRYALARQTLLSAAAVPFVALAASVYRNRDLRVADLATSAEGAALGALALLGLASRRWRDRLLARLDARFFREPHHAEVVLGGLIADCGRTRDRSELTTVLRAALDHALHPEAVHVLFRDERRRAFAATTDEVSPIAADGALGAWILGQDRATEVDLARPNVSLAALGPADRDWLLSADVRLLVPARDAEGALVAFLTLGEKKSELPYTAEDRSVLQAVAGALALALASYQRPAAPPGEAATYAAECPACGLVYTHDVTTCRECAVPTPTRAAMLPRTVAGKFETHRRIGAGGMGVVYRGIDLTLGRTVAIKTLPFVSHDDTERMRREARAMAAVRHENLALIYTAEVWHDRPMLVVEYLGGGTLADRLADGPLPLSEWLALGAALTGALTALHREGVVHGDVKPSNIGYAADGTPKLLDFGLAHVVTFGGTTRGSPPPNGVRPGPATSGGASVSASHSIAFGTPRYMAPEAGWRGRPAPADDLWSACVVLYEAAAAAHPFGQAAADAAGDAWVREPDTRPFTDAGMDEVAALFRDGLAADPSRRPASAEQLRARLLRGRDKLPAKIGRRRGRPATRRGSASRGTSRRRSPGTRWRPPRSRTSACPARPRGGRRDAYGASRRSRRP